MPFKTICVQLLYVLSDSHFSLPHTSRKGLRVYAVALATIHLKTDKNCHFCIVMLSQKVCTHSRMLQTIHSYICLTLVVKFWDICRCYGNNP